MSHASSCSPSVKLHRAANSDSTDFLVVLRDFLKREYALVSLALLVLRLRLRRVRLHPAALVLSGRDGVPELQSCFAGLGVGGRGIPKTVP